MAPDLAEQEWPASAADQIVQFRPHRHRVVFSLVLRGVAQKGEVGVQTAVIKLRAGNDEWRPTIILSAQRQLF